MKTYKTLSAIAVTLGIIAGNASADLPSSTVNFKWDELPNDFYCTFNGSGSGQVAINTQNVDSVGFCSSGDPNIIITRPGHLQGDANAITKYYFHVVRDPKHITGGDVLVSALNSSITSINCQKGTGGRAEFMPGSRPCAAYNPTPEKPKAKKER
ncbi:MAG: hypothetical protein K0S08_181 [Gammaproteobacteria bacterium]|nr:hypothetical protein [Gammaproteobacteria bacterium]